jgi:hypothetical protein
MNHIETPIKGYKVTDADMKCKGFQYELDKEYTFSGTISICNTGFHFCPKLSHCFNYYEFNKTNRVFEVEGWGDLEQNEDKCCVSKIRLIKELTWAEVLLHANEGADNTGYGNTGYSNTGYSNTGNRNTGNSNTGYSNTGYSNTGNRNTGNSNTGNRNTGNSNTGNSNTGYSNTGNRNTGNSNTGNSNTGNRNTGNSNTGNSNTGDRNTGDRNTGDSNTGYSNTGYSNTGYSNTGNRNTGAFCTGDPVFTLFNKPADWTAEKFLNSKAWGLIVRDVDTKLWVPESKMTDTEKESNKGWKTAEGFYRDIPYKEAFTNAWGNWDKESRQSFLDLPNFDPEIFEFITGVKVNP